MDGKATTARKQRQKEHQLVTARVSLGLQSQQ